MKFSFIHIEIGTNCHNKNFALILALKERLKGTRKWPIIAKEYVQFNFLYYSNNNNKKKKNVEKNEE